MKKTKFQLRHKRERNKRRPIDKERYAELTKNFRGSYPAPYEKEGVFHLKQGDVHFRVNRLGQICEIKSNDPHIISFLQNRPRNLFI